MGKRKSASSKAAPRKKMEKLETTFCCPFCSHAAAVECVIDLEQEIATASCYVCQESYSTVPDTLTEPIDVYSEWIDECERVNEGVPRHRRPVVCKLFRCSCATNVWRAGGGRRARIG
jgi:transcription elongation factor Elf1